MSLILFGTVIRTRRSLGKIISKALKEGRTGESMEWAIHTYNTGIFGLLFYRTNNRRKGIEFFKSSIKR